LQNFCINAVSVCIWLWLQTSYHHTCGIPTVPTSILSITAYVESRVSESSEWCGWDEAACDWNTVNSTAGQSVVDQAIDQWLDHPNACIKANSKQLVERLMCCFVNSSWRLHHCAGTNRLTLCCISQTSPTTRQREREGQFYRYFVANLFQHLLQKISRTRFDKFVAKIKRCRPSMVCKDACGTYRPMCDCLKCSHLYC